VQIGSAGEVLSYRVSYFIFGLSQHLSMLAPHNNHLETLLGPQNCLIMRIGVVQHLERMFPLESSVSILRVYCSATWRSTPQGARNQSHHAYTPGGQSALSLDLFHLTLYSTPAATSLRSESDLEAWLPDQSRLRTAKLDRVQNRAALKQGHGQLVHRVDERKA
jgi:hypothetical protein